MERADAQGHSPPPASSEQAGVIGKHVYADLYGSDPRLLNDVEFLKEVVVEAVKASRATLVDIKAWRFGGDKGGVSVLALVVESHVALHTWPKHAYATVDIYTCGESSDPWKALEVVLVKLKPRSYHVHYADRSGPRP